MNWYVYFASPYLSTYKIPSPFQKQATAFILKVKASPLPFRTQQAILYPLLQDLHQANQYGPEESQQKALVAFQKANQTLQKAIEAQKEDSSRPLAFFAQFPWLLRLSDVFAFGALWIGGYQAFNQILETHHLEPFFSIGLSNFGQALLAYLCLQGTLNVLMRLEGWKRWLSLASLFALYLVLMQLLARLGGIVPIRAINVILICVLIFFISLALNVYVYGKPISNG